MIVPRFFFNRSTEEFNALFREAAALRAARDKDSFALRDYIMSPATQEPVGGDRNHSMLKLLDAVQGCIIPRYEQSRLFPSMITMALIHPEEYGFIVEEPDGSLTISDDEKDHGCTPQIIAEKFLGRAFAAAQKVVTLLAAMDSNPGYYTVRVSRDIAIKFREIDSSNYEFMERMARIVDAMPPATAPDYLEQARQIVIPNFPDTIAMDGATIEEQIFAFNQKDVECARAANALVAAITTVVGQSVPFTKAFLDRNTGIDRLIQLSFT